MQARLTTLYVQCFLVTPEIPREKLAYIADSSSAPTSILIPFNAWGAFIMGLLITQNIENPFSVMLSSIVYNFYPILALMILFIVIVSKKDIGSMAKAEKRTRTTGKLMDEGSKPMISDVITSFAPKEGIKAKSFNMVIPLLTMVIMMPVNLAYTGWAKVEKSASSILDIGSGTGLIALMMAQRSFAEQIDAVEIEDAAYEQCVDNFETSDWGDRLFCYHASLDEFTDYGMDLSDSTPQGQRTDYAQASAIRQQLIRLHFTSVQN